MTAASTARVLVPLLIADATFGAGTSIVEPAAGETAWVSAGSYTLGDERIRATTHRVYEAVQTHTGRTALPELDEAYWKEIRPTLRWAPFDDYSNTKAKTVTTLTYVLNPGFLNGLALYGLEGESITITVKTGPGGTVVYTYTGELYEQAVGLYELLFSPLRQLTQISFDDIPLTPASEVTITITAGAGLTVAVGTIKIGDWRPFKGNGVMGGAQWGAEADRTSYTFRQYNPDGTYKTIKRASSRDLRVSVRVNAAESMYADALLAEVADVAVPFEATNFDNYAFLNTLGFVSGTIRADDYGTTSLNLTVKGTI